KLFATESVRPVVNECYQIFGGYAYMEDYPIARIYRDVAAMTIGAGTSEIMREIISRENKVG
ncbi:MAG: acyl-CoA dehydrogenase, partial [Desulfobacterales bacterium]|nr:acyl-CoA dehydrogenase [Desulfobacterales bacterium]